MLDGCPDVGGPVVGCSVFAVDSAGLVRTIANGLVRPAGEIVSTEGVLVSSAFNVDRPAKPSTQDTHRNSRIFSSSLYPMRCFQTRAPPRGRCRRWGRGAGGPGSQAEDHRFIQRFVPEAADRGREG